MGLQAALRGRSRWALGVAAMLVAAALVVGGLTIGRDRDQSRECRVGMSK